MPPNLSREHQEACFACHPSSVDEHKEATNGVSEMSPKLSVEHKEACSACRQSSVLSIRRQVPCAAGAR